MTFTPVKWAYATLIFVCLAACSDSKTFNAEVLEELRDDHEDQEPDSLYGLPLSNHQLIQARIAAGEFLADILLRHNVSYNTIAQLEKAAKDVYPVTKLRAGGTYTLFLAGDSLPQAHYFVVDINKTDYAVYSLQDIVAAWMGSKPVQLRQRTAAGIIHSSLYQTIADQNLPASLAPALADIYAWSVDFYRIQSGDYFKIHYTEKVVDGEVVGLHEIAAAEFSHRGKVFPAFLFHDGDVTQYFDEEGESLRKAFLKAPLEFSRISSRYSKQRFHPVQKRWKAHLGTDYAAPAGTPIMSTGDGVVVESAYGKYNGNYVKVRHNSTYSTQYLHMSKRAVNKGDAVRQGQLIGYVGATGLATGPHVCYRFWKNGTQIDPYSEQIPPSKPVPQALRKAFEAHVDTLAAQLADIQLPLTASAEDLPDDAEGL